jgi:hypothetical protein
MTEIFPPVIELMQRTVDLTWNKPEWMLPQISTDDILIAYTNGMVFHGGYDKAKGEFHGNGFLVELEFIDFWAYMPKYPTK